jgi:translation initiation factor IF-2
MMGVPMPHSVDEFAQVLKVPADRLMQQLEMVGISKSNPGDPISEEEKLQLLNHLRRSHGAELRQEAKRKLPESEKRSSRAWARAMVEQEEAEKKIIVGRAFDPSGNDDDASPDSDSDRF